MTDGLSGIITQLERQRTAIEHALEALRNVDGTEANGTQAAAPGSAPKRKGGMTPAGRRRLSLALKKRWAAKRAAAEVSVPAKAVPRKGTLTPAGRQRLAAAMRKRWALAKAAVTTPIKAAKKAGRAKKAA